MLRDATHIYKRDMAHRSTHEPGGLSSIRSKLMPVLHKTPSVPFLMFRTKMLITHSAALAAASVPEFIKFAVVASKLVNTTSLANINL